MPKLDRRSFLATTAGLSFLLALPRIAFADGHPHTLRVAITGETGDLGLLQNVSTLATAWTVTEDRLSISFDLREGVTFSDGTAF